LTEATWRTPTFDSSGSPQVAKMRQRASLACSERDDGPIPSSETSGGSSCRIDSSKSKVGSMAKVDVVHLEPRRAAGEAGRVEVFGMTRKMA
jgi:hypothetical protein